MPCIAAEGCGEAGGLAHLAICKVCVHNCVLGVRDVCINAGEAHGKDHAWLSDPVVVCLEHDDANLGERVIGNQGFTHGPTVRSAESGEWGGYSGDRGD